MEVAVVVVTPKLTGGEGTVSAHICKHNHNQGGNRMIIFVIKTELCRAHTPRAHCAIYRFTF